MNKLIKGFTLVELVVGITISMILMVSVGVFIGNGMQSIFSQQKILKNTDNFTNFAGSLHLNFNLIQSGSFSPVETLSGIIVRRGQNYSEGGFSYIGTETLSGVYCDSDSEDPKTNNIFIKNFIPFEEKSEDIFVDYEKILTSTKGDYTSYQKEHIIKNSIGTVLIGKEINSNKQGIFGNEFVDGSFGVDIYLNSPTGLALNGNILYISDTLNNRILYYDTSNLRIYKLLDENDGLNEPTGLYYDTSDDSLYIANSGNGEILKYSSESISNNDDLNLSFSGITVNNINKLSIEFLSGSINLSSPNEMSEISDYTFTNINNNTDYLTGNTNKVEYYFSDYSNTESTDGPKSIPGCSTDTNYFLEGNNPKKEVISCSGTNTGTITKYNGDITTDFNGTTTYSIDITNIEPLLSNTGTHYINLKLYDGSNEEYSGYFPYFIQGDNDLITVDDNSLVIYSSGLIYPTGIWKQGLDIQTKQFIKKKFPQQDSDRNFSNKILEYDKNYDNLLKSPIKSLEITNNDLLTIILKYYKKYNCYNLDDKSERTFIIKKNLK